jgi:hypothetical protein
MISEACIEAGKLDLNRVQDCSEAVLTGAQLGIQEGSISKLSVLEKKQKHKRRRQCES